MGEMRDSLETRAVKRRVLILLFVVLIALSPAAALSMSHCAAMMSAACQGPCATYACAGSLVPRIQAPAYVEGTVAHSVDRTLDAPPGIPDPPPRSLSLTA
jgi:hypothetical protein